MSVRKNTTCAPTPPRPAVMAGVLIGGQSRRMGRPKHLLALGGQTMVERAVAALDGMVDRIVLLGAGEAPPSIGGLTRVADVDGVTGPLAGLLAAMRWATQAAWLFVPCDHPRLRPDAVQWLLEQRHPHEMIIMPRRTADSPPEPLFALYEPPARGLLEDLSGRGCSAPRELAGSALLPVVPAHLADAWISANTESELASLKGTSRLR